MKKLLKLFFRKVVNFFAKLTLIEIIKYLLEDD